MPNNSLTVLLEGRGLLTHEAAGLRDRGVAETLSWNPPPSGRGPQLTLTQSVGAGAALRGAVRLRHSGVRGRVHDDSGGWGSPGARSASGSTPRSRRRGARARTTTARPRTGRFRSGGSRGPVPWRGAGGCWTSGAVRRCRPGVAVLGSGAEPRQPRSRRRRTLARTCARGPRENGPHGAEPLPARGDQRDRLRAPDPRRRPPQLLFGAQVRRRSTR